MSAATASQVRYARLSMARARAGHTDGAWRTLVDLCGSACVACGSAGPLVKDHVVPLSRGGHDGISNLQPLCEPCNLAKHTDSADHRPRAVLIALLRLIGGC